MADAVKTNLDSLNDSQKEAVLSEASRLLVLAGAGSGKTKTLLQKLVYLIEEKGVSPSSILAITFTKNATNEMIDRLIISADQTKQYEAMLADKRLSKLEKDRQRLLNQKKYKWIDGLTVRTFHSFCYSGVTFCFFMSAGASQKYDLVLRFASLCRYATESCPCDEQEHMIRLKTRKKGTNTGLSIVMMMQNLFG